MAYRKGRRVRIVKGYLAGNKATVLFHVRKGRMVLYELKVDGRFWPFRVRGSYLRAIR